MKLAIAILGVLASHKHSIAIVSGMLISYYSHVVMGVRYVHDGKSERYFHASAALTVAGLGMFVWGFAGVITSLYPL